MQAKFNGGTDLMNQVVESAKNGKLVIIAGTGLSMGLTEGKIPSWSKLIANGFSFAAEKDRISASQVTSWENQCQSSDLDDLLSAAEYIGRKLGAPDDLLYARWLEKEFKAAVATNAELAAAVKSIASYDVPICTLNYDSLLENVTGFPSLLLQDTQKVAAWLRREYQAILHLHGSWDSPGSCILGIRDYETTLNDEVRDLFQRSLSAFNHLLFIGCGDTLSDPNFSALISWLHTKFKVLTLPHVALVRDADLKKRHADPAWQGFVEPLSFGAEHSDLAKYILQYFPKLKPRKSASSKRSVASHEFKQVLETYRKFLLRDCGQMTIEGVSADFDTGQRKFDIERLFVPLQVSACPPEFPPNDPNAEEKLSKWQEENKETLSFGAILEQKKCIALLALPGGGKTLLLKRLAVAYADPYRRTASSDALPDFDLLPILIRCREWRDYIHLPVMTLLKKIGDITGQPELLKLAEAIRPLLSAGKVLLLVDGLDEIHSDADRATFVENLEKFIEEFANVRVVITSREAGFNLVAPSLLRFCERWRISPLAEDAINLLCMHWHRLMAGDTPSAKEEGQSVADLVIRNPSLRRLAENPLLLTMLLVVKHGAGSLPPDRVSLYGRAVEVLLDTWNIKGHAPLNVREAVPQLAYVAFELMCLGKQTATENELVKLLTIARDKHPNIARYAKDSPHEFLKRVELRSSLLLEAGHQIENGRTVPFYQFRHLTFQEYLAAVAATEGHYEAYSLEDSVLTPLESHLLSEKWKEVIPMAAVLAKKQAEPLLNKLIAHANIMRNKVLKGKEDDSVYAQFGKDLAGAPGRLFQCFLEEAIAAPDTLRNALQVVAFFAYGCRTSDPWNTICQGPFGEELYRQAWEVLDGRKWDDSSWMMNNCAAIAAYRHPLEFWSSAEGQIFIKSLLKSSDRNEVAQGLLICMGVLWNHGHEPTEHKTALKAVPLDLVAEHVMSSDYQISCIAIWAWANKYCRISRRPALKVELLDSLLKCWLADSSTRRSSMGAYGLSKITNVKRGKWKPALTTREKTAIRKKFSGNLERFMHHDTEYHLQAAIIVGFHSQDLFSDQELMDMMDSVNERTLQNSAKDWKSIKDQLSVRQDKH